MFSMKAATIIYLCVAIFPLVTHANKKLRDELDGMAARNGTIHQIFELAKTDGYLGSGFFSIVYKGTLLCPVKKEVAMKFTPFSYKEEAEIEYKMYTYLNAIDNPNVEDFGVPAVYYYGTWKNNILLAITLLEPEFTDRVRKVRTQKFSTVDILIVCKEYVRALKYIHSRGVLHKSIKLGNLMFRMNRGFIIDYNIADALHNEGDETIVKRNEIEDAKFVWTRLLASVCDIAGVKVDWIEIISHPKEYSHKLRPQIEKVECNEVKGLLKEMATYAFDNEITNGNTVFAFYERFYQNVEKVMTKLQISNTSLVSWLKDDKKKGEAKRELAKIPKISSITDQFQNVDAKYPQVEPNYFKLKYPQC